MALQSGKLEHVQLILNKIGSFPSGFQDGIILYGTVEMLIWASNNGLDVNNRTLKIAAMMGKLDMVKCITNLGVEWNHEVAERACSYLKGEVALWILQTGRPFTARATRYALNAYQSKTIKGDDIHDLLIRAGAPHDRNEHSDKVWLSVRRELKGLKDTPMYDNLSSLVKSYLLNLF